MRGFGELLGESTALVGLRRELQQLVRRYATARRLPPVLLLGETGTGKSVIARVLHGEGPRAARSFVDVACPEIPETLMESEMFGVERGAFTDARQSRPGRFAEADRGTIFLDEIGLLPDNLQAKLLKIVEEQQLRPLGATGSRPIDVLVIAATSEDLEEAVRKRRFREDLYFRLAVVAVRVPPLRERGDDVVILARHLLARACADYGLASKTFTQDAVAALKAHRWPGNIRELGNVIERVALRSEGPLVTADILGLPGSVGGLATAAGDGRAGGRRPGIDEVVASLERQHLIGALDAAGGNVSRAAQHLGLTRNTFRYRLRKHGLARGRRNAPSSHEASLAPRPFVAPRWERRRVVFVRVALASPGREVETKPRALLEQVREKIVLFGGTLDGMSPCGITAVFGLDLLEDAARRAAHAAMAIRKLGVRARDADPTLPAMSIAIHAVRTLLWKATDDVHVDAEARPDIWQALDRLVTAAGDASIVVSEPTTIALAGAFHLTEMDDRTDGARLLLDGERAPRVPDSVFVGRGDEMAVLRGRLDMALGGRGQVVGIDGEPGIGKSRLLLELRRTLPVDTATYLDARSHSYGRDIALLPIVELLRRAHGIEDDDSPAVARVKLSARLAALGMAAIELVPYLLRLIGIDEGSEGISHLSPQALHQRTLEIFRDVTLTTSRIHPLVIAVEDLHWMDRASEGYLAALIDAIVEAPILLLTTFRSGYRPPWSERTYVSELRLQPLARADARRVLDAALERDRGPASLPAATAAAILERADGNPFFIEELARALGPVSVAPLAAVPQSIEAVILARIDRLPLESRSILQAASVLGRDVPVPLLEAITPDLGAVKEHLRELGRLEYLHDRSDGAQECYRFKHALTQEVAYADLLPERRRELHARVVSVVEAQHGDRLDEQTERVAHHAIQGHLWPKALAYFRQAGLRATARSANHEAVVCFEEALRALTQLPEGQAALEAIDIRLEMFTGLVALAQYGRCLTYLADAAKLAEVLREHGRLGRARAGQCIVLRIMGATDDAIEAGQQANALARDVGDAELVATTNFFLGTAYAARGDFRQAASCYRESFNRLEGEVTRERAQALPRYAGTARAWLAWTLEVLGEYREALTLAREAIQIAEARGDRVQQASASCLLGNVYLGLGEWAQAIPLLERALALCRSHDVRDWLGLVTMRLGLAYAQAGRLAAGLTLLEESVAHSEATGQITNYPARIARLAQCYLLAGRRAEAVETIQRGTALARQYGQRPDEAECLRVMGLVAAAAEPTDVVEAEAYFTQARDLATALGMRPLVAHCHLDLGRLCLRTGKHDRAREDLTTATTIYQELDMPFWLQAAQAEARKLS